jgi:L,D-transpeptidase catalytic domain
MKTKSIIHARRQYGMVLIAFLATVSVSAQMQFASQNDYSFSARPKLSAISSLNYFVPVEPLPGGRPAASINFSASLFGNNIAEEIYDRDKPGTLTNLRVSKNDIRSVAANAEIRFKHTSFTYPMRSGKDIGIAQYSSEQLILYATTLKRYARKHGFDTTYAFFSNMGMLNNKRRFFVVNLVTMKIEQSGMVAQGRGQGPSRFDKQYSNKRNSKCTSLGRYKIMKKYKGEYGEAYKMMGLDSSNCNAFRRNIVLHSMGCMPDAEDNMPVCISEGCPAVSVKFLSSLSKIIDSRKKPMLLWIFDSNLEEVVIEQKPANHALQEVDEKKYHICPLHHPRNKMNVEL